MLFSVLFKYGMHTAVGNGKIIIVVSNMISLFRYVRSGNVLNSAALPASAVNIVGSEIGTSLAVKKGETAGARHAAAHCGSISGTGILKLIQKIRRTYNESETH